MSNDPHLRREFQKFQQRVIKAHRRGDAAAELGEIEEQILNGSPELKAQALEYRAQRKQRSADLAAAKQDYFLALELADHPHLRQMIQAGIAHICEAENDPAGALDWYRKALHEGRGSGYELKSILRLNDGKIDEADRDRTIEIIQRTWAPFKMPGEPDLNDLSGCIHALDRRLNQIADEAMIPRDVGEVIAERHLVYVDEHGVERPALVQIGRPRPSAEHEGHVQCFYRITGLDYERVFSEIGVDEIDALRIALNAIGADLEHTQAIMEGEIRWPLGEDGDLGFPQRGDFVED